MGKHQFVSPAFPQQGGSTMKLTAANISLPESKSDAIFFDDTVRGFGLRVRRLSGGVIRKYWIVQYRAHGHASRMIVGDAAIITAAQARTKARDLLAQVQLGGDPQRDKQERRDKDTLSLRGVVSDFIAQKIGVKEGTLRMLRTYLEGPLYLKPLHGVPIDRITRKDIAARLLAVSKANGIPTAIAFRSALSSLFVWTMTMGLVEHNPLVGAFRPKTPKSRDRVLTDAELAVIWNQLGDDDDYGKVVKLLMLTGCRRGEIAGMRRSEFDLDKGTWTLPATRSKNAKPHTLPLTPLMLEIIESIPRREPFNLLFGRKHGFTGWSIGKRALDERLGLPAWVHHDIRRSVATGMNDIGIQPHIVEEILNHQSGHKRGVAGIYNKSPYANEVVSAMLRWSTHIAEITSGGSERKVVAFERTAVAATP
jgi:integrase